MVCDDDVIEPRQQSLTKNHHQERFCANGSYAEMASGLAGDSVPDRCCAVTKDGTGMLRMDPPPQPHGVVVLTIRDWTVE
ncbi:unnamed protein product [Phytomonas sp. EM1]|nr:unnamed protein product [Phytomonas sp. EM1]|eukprot:CCW64482.1 unnamed protein product [Phytomonas sp. isolate EM1]